MTRFAYIRSSAVSHISAVNNEPLSGVERIIEVAPEEVLALGYLYDPITGQFSDPALAPADPVAVHVSPVQFKLLFTSAERIAIKTARETDPIIDDFFEIVEDPRLTVVDLSLDSTKEALSYLESLGFITDDRRREILSGQPR